MSYQCTKSLYNKPQTNQIYRAKGPHTWCEDLTPHVRRTYNIKRIGKTSAGIW